MRNDLNKDSPTEGEKFVSSWAALSAETGISERQWRIHSKRDGFPQKTSDGYDVLACIEWRKANVNPQAGKSPTGEGLNAKREAKLDEEIRLLRLKAAKEERSVLDAAEVDSFHLRLALKCKSTLAMKLITELNPKLEGLSAAERIPVLEQACDAVCDAMREGFDEWAAEA